MNRFWQNPGVRTSIAVLGAVVLPFFLLTGYVASATTQNDRNFRGEEIAQWLSILVGVGFVFLLPIRLPLRIAFAVLYILPMYAVLFCWMILFVCGRFNACL